MDTIRKRPVKTAADLSPAPLLDKIKKAGG